MAGYFTKWDKLSEDQRLRLLQTSAEFCRCVDFRELSLAKRIEYLLLRPEFADKMIWQDVLDAGDWYRLMAVIPSCRKFAPSDAIVPEAKGRVWLGKSGPVVVIPRSGEQWQEDCPPFAVGNRERLGQYQLSYQGVSWSRNRGDYDISYEEHAVLTVDHVLSNKTAASAFAIDIEGVYVDRKDIDGVRRFAKILKRWFLEHETSIKIVYLECGEKYPSGAL